MYSQTNMANMLDVGIRDINFRAINYYNPSSYNGNFIKELYQHYLPLRSQETSFGNLPEEFDPLVLEIQKFILENSVQTDPKNQFYVGPNGERNGVGFRFNKNELPTKLVRLSFCFGIDPLMFTALVKQESKFSKNAVSNTYASGFTQQTSDAIAESSEQLGIIGVNYQSPDSVEILNEYIKCYLGPNKKWSNMWPEEEKKKDNKELNKEKVILSKHSVPAGAAAYRGRKLGAGRVWLYVSKSKDWLNEDPDRNLIYGAIYFKAMLNRPHIKGNYYSALSKYNVAERSVYTKSIKGYYRGITPGLKERISEAPVNLQRVSYKTINFLLDDFECAVPEDDAGFEAYEVLEGLVSDEEIKMDLLKVWQKNKYCKTTVQST